MGMKSSSPGPGPVVWIVAVASIGALAFLGWRSNQSRPVAAPTTAPAAAPQEPQPQAPIVPATEANGSAAG